MTTSTPPSPEALASALATPLSSLRVPTRMQNFFDRRGLATVRDLVAYAPASLLLEPNLGRKSVADTRVALRQRFAMSWETLREGGGAPDASALLPRAPAEEWAAFAAQLPPQVLELPIRDSGLPARMQTFAARELFTCVAELVAVPYDELAERRGIGTGTLRESLAHLRSILLASTDASAAPAVTTPAAPAAPVDPLPPGSHWKALLTGALRELAPRERLVVTQRSGLAGPPQTLAELGECLGFSRERARQLESRGLDRIRVAPWRLPASERLESRCQRTVEVVSTWAQNDSLFAVGDDDDDDAFLFFVNDVLAVRPRAFKLDDVLVLAREPRDAVERRLANAKATASSLAFPFPWAERESRLATAIGCEVESIVDLAPFLDEGWIVDDGAVTGYGTTKRRAVVAFVRALGRPASRVELEERFGRMPMPQPLMLVGYGMFALPEQVPDWERWRKRVPPVARAILERDGPERQWSMTELLPRLAEEADLPDWLNEWALGSLLRDVPDVRYLGRNVVSLPETAEARLHVDEVMTTVLADAGAPILETELVDRVKRARGLGQHTWTLMRMKRPFLLFADGRVGLAPRDIPGGADVAARFADALYESLYERQHGLSSTELRSLVEGRAGWDLRLARSVLRHDGRFRAAAGGSVGLAEWEGTRAPSQRDILEELMIEHDGIVPVETAIAMVPTASGEPLSRERVGLLANSIRARLVGPCIEWMVDREESTTIPAIAERALAEIPETATTMFRAYVTRHRPAEDLREALEQWASTMRAEAARNPFVEPPQVERVVGAASEVLEALERTNDPGLFATCSAAVEYVVAIDDAQTDTALGGLDDDEAVVDVVGRLIATEAARSPPQLAVES